MTTIEFENGVSVEFEGNPTQQDVEEVANQLNINKSVMPNELPKKLWETLPKKSAEEAFAGGLKKYATEVVPQSAIGGAKGVLSTVQGMANLGQSALNATVGKTIGKNKLLAQMPKSWTKPSNVFQEGGKFGEQLAEFAIPAGTISKASKAVEASKAPKLIRYLAKPVVEGLGAAGVVSAQEGEVGKDARNAGLAVGGLTLGGKALNSIIQKIPETAWSAILKRTPTEARKNPLLSKKVAETKMTGWSREGLQKQAQEAVEKIEMQIDDLLTVKSGFKPYQKQFITTSKNVKQPISATYSSVKKTGGLIETKKVAEYLTDLKTAYSHIPGEQSSVEAIDTIAKDLMKKPTLTPLEANQLKRNIYQHIAKSYGRGTLEIPVKIETQKQIARGLKSEIEKIIPEVKSLNEKQAVYIQVKKALDATIARGEGKGVAGTGIGLYDLVGGGVVGMGTGQLPTVAGGLIAKRIFGKRIATGASAMITAFNQMSPTKKLLFYTAIKGLAAEGSRNK